MQATKNNKRGSKTVKFENYLIAVYNKSVELQRDIDLIKELKSEFSHLALENEKENSNKLAVLYGLCKLGRRINNLLIEIQKTNELCKQQ
jgi:hypothetical protein